MGSSSEYPVQSNFICRIASHTGVVIVDLYDLWPSWPTSHTLRRNTIIESSLCGRVSSFIRHYRVTSLLSPGRIALVRAALTTASVTEGCIAVNVNTKSRRMSANQVFWICDMLRLLSSNRPCTVQPCQFDTRTASLVGTATELHHV